MWYLKLKQGSIPSDNIRIKRLRDELKDKAGRPSRFNKSRFIFFLDAPFEISDQCCAVMKKKPAHSYEKETGRKPIIATMTDESFLRLKNWLHDGCNAFDAVHPSSKPMSFWTEQDVLRYIKINNVKIASVYGDVIPIEDDNRQITIEDLGLVEDKRKLKTTGCSRTGCVFCGFGCHNEKGTGRFEKLKQTHPQLYQFLMKPVSEGGLGYKEIIDWINQNGDFNIKY